MDKQKMDFYGQTSSSSSLTNVQVEMNNQEPSTSKKVEGGSGARKIKDKSKPDGEKQEEVENKCSIDDLPTEMLMKLSLYLDAKSLVNCRLMNWRWNEIGREILESRVDFEGLEAEIKCWKRDNGNFNTSHHNPLERLENFMKWFRTSSINPFLYSAFSFIDLKISALDHPTWLKFIRNFGQRIKSLKLVVVHDEYCNGEGLAEKLRDLLLNQLRNLQEFGLHFSSRPINSSLLFQQQLPLPMLLGVQSNLLYGYTNNSSPLQGIRLFPTILYNHYIGTVVLPHLKVLYLNDEFIRNNFEIFTDLLGACVNLEKIEPFEKDEYFKSVENFELLQSLGKLCLLQNVELIMENQFNLDLNYGYYIPLKFNLKKVKLTIKSYILNNGDFGVDDVSLLESSKDFLTHLTIPPLGFLHTLQFPKFNKLTNLCISDRWEQNLQAWPPKLRLLDIFPALKTLKLEAPWTECFPNFKRLSPIPTLKGLKILGHGMTKEGILRISQVCPNLTELEIGNDQLRDGLENFPQVGEAIWTHLKKLVSLELTINLNAPVNAFTAVDSTFTGFSGEYCEYLLNLIEKETVAKKQGSQIKISQSELDAERKSPSILDLKDLEKLKVHSLWSGDSNSTSSQCPGSVDMILIRISEEYAFKVMDKLTYEFSSLFEKFKKS